jgi:hypothetical protein
MAPILHSCLLVLLRAFASANGLALNGASLALLAGISGVFPVVYPLIELVCAA